MPPRAAAPVGIGWRAPHHAALLAGRPRLGFVEVHAENHFAEGGAALAALLAVRAFYPLSLHGVGLALGSAAGLDAAHLERLARLVERTEPMLVSEHASFARAPTAPRGPVRHAADLLPTGRTPAALALLAEHVAQVQDRLRRPILIEHLATCLGWADEADALPETEFFNALCRRTGCGLLLDLNNLVVNALNASAGGTDTSPDAGRDRRPDPALASDPDRAPARDLLLDAVCRFVDALDPAIVGQIHLAGHAPAHAGSGGWVIDDHGRAVPPAVWRAYAHALAVLGPRPTLIEWDTQLPPLADLVAQARLAEAVQPARHDASLAGAPSAAWGGPQGACAAEPAGSGTDASESSIRTDRVDLGTSRLAGAGAGADAGAGAGAGACEAAAVGTTPRAREAERQQCLVAALAAPAGSAEAAVAEAALAPWLAAPVPGRAPMLAVLRANARAQAARALAAAYPAVAAALGDEAFASLARRHWLEHPPASGDLGEWGEALPAALAADDLLQAWPWLSDLARLDWAIHRCERAADAPPGPPVLDALAGAEPETLGLQFTPGAAVAASGWPIATLRGAVGLADHRQPARARRDEAADAPAQEHPRSGGPGDTAHAQLQAQAEAALSRHQAERVIVWRPPGEHRAHTTVLAPADAACAATLLAGGSLDQALGEALALDGAWSFTDWLVQACRQGWLLGARPLPGSHPAAE